MAGSVTSDMFNSQSGVNRSGAGSLSKMRSGGKSGTAKKAVGKASNRSGAPKPAAKADRMTKSPELREGKGASQQQDFLSAQINAMTKMLGGGR